MLSGISKIAFCLEQLWLTCHLVSDNRVLLTVTTRMIKKLGYEVLRATNGTDASQIFRHNKDVINLVVLETDWPDELESDTCLKLKEIDSGAKIIHISCPEQNLS